MAKYSRRRQLLRSGYRLARTLAGKAYYVLKSANYKPTVNDRGTKSRVRSMRSMTKTKTKKKSKYQTVKQSTFTTKSFAAKYHKVISKHMAKNSYDSKRFQRSTDSTNRLAAAVGRQSFATTVTLCDSSQLADQFTQIGALATQKWFLKSMSLTNEFHNQSNTGVKIWIYDCLCRIDGCQSPSNEWNQGLVTDQGSTANSPNQPFATPMVVDDFKRAWTVIKCTRVSLEAGQSHVHNFKYAYNRVISQDRYENLGSGSNVAGITVAQMVVTLGALDNDSTTKDQVSYGITAVNVYNKRKFVFNTVLENSLTSVNISGLPLAFTVAENTMLEDTDLAAVVVPA